MAEIGAILHRTQKRRRQHPIGRADDEAINRSRIRAEVSTTRRESRALPRQTATRNLQFDGRGEVAALMMDLPMVIERADVPTKTCALLRFFTDPKPTYTEEEIDVPFFGDAPNWSLENADTPPRNRVETSSHRALPSRTIAWSRGSTMTMSRWRQSRFELSRVLLDGLREVAERTGEEASLM